MPLALEDGGVPGMQGAAVVDGTWFVTTSRGRYRLGSVWVGRPGALREHRWQLPVGPEDITYWPERDQLWSLSEYPGARYVYAMPRSRFLRERAMTLEDLVEALRRGVPEVHDVLLAHLAELPGGDEFVLLGLLRERALVLFDAGLRRGPRPAARPGRPGPGRGRRGARRRGHQRLHRRDRPWDPVMDPFVSVWPIHLRAQAAVETARSDDS